MATFFCDGLKEITILNGVARLEFHRMQASEAGQPNRDVRPITELVLALPAQGFVQAVAMLDRVRDELVKQGVVKPPPAENAPPRPAGRSPNFG
jgi:hypothetical protein